jgi:hypothetical protein
MARANFATSPYPNPIPDFQNLSLGTSNATDDILLYGLKHGVAPQSAMDFERLKRLYEEASRAKIEEVLRTGDASDATLHAKRSAARDFFTKKKDLRAHPDFDFLSNPISRKDFDISPYEIPGKNRLDHPFPGATAAMDGIWPGYDKPEYLLQYPFLSKEKYGGKLINFLRHHEILFNLPETFARYGGAFVPHPYVTQEMNIELRKHLEQCDLLFHTAPIVYPNTTKEELDLVLSYYEDDFVAVVMDRPKGSVIGVAGHKEMDDKDANAKVEDFMSRNWHDAPEQDLKADDLYAYMESNGKHRKAKILDENPQDIDMNGGIPFLLKLEDGKPPRIVTQTTASLSHFLPPFKYKNGLGSMAYFRISDLDESNKILAEMLAQTDGFPGAIVETAHADTEFVRDVFRTFRKKLQDVFMMSGTVIDPYAIDEFMMMIQNMEQTGQMFQDERQDADAMKLGIAEGHACRTSTTGVRLTNAFIALLCGASTWKDGTLALDGWGLSDEFIIGLSAHSVRMRQGGGAIVARRESANPFLNVNGKKGKFYRGMAGAEMQQEVLGSKTQRLHKRMEARTHLHSEGAEEFVPERFPSSIGRMMLMYKFLLQSAMSYSGVRAEIKEKPLMQFQKRSTWSIVPKKAA